MCCFPNLIKQAAAHVLHHPCVCFGNNRVVEFAVDAIDRPLKHPRIEVKDGIVFYCSDDRIEQIDVLQATLDAEAAEAAE